MVASLAPLAYETRRDDQPKRDQRATSGTMIERPIHSTTRCDDPHFIQAWLKEVRDDVKKPSPVLPEFMPQEPFSEYNFDKTAAAKKGIAGQRRASWRPEDLYIDPRISESAESEISTKDGPMEAGRCNDSGQDRVSDTEGNPFKKRARRKTRPDRYEPHQKRHEGANKDRREKRKHHDPEPRQVKHKHRLRSGKNVMQRFESAAINSDRVIVSLTFLH